MTASRLIDLLRRADWLGRERAIAWGGVMLAVQLLLLVFVALWQRGVFVTITQPTSSDFVSFYAAGKLALAGTPALAYDQTAHYAAQQLASTPGAPYQYFFYPPVFLILCSGLAVLPYGLAFALFQVVTIVLFLAVMRAVLRETGLAWAVPLLAFPPVFWTIGLGQNAFLTAALLGAFTLLVDRRPGWAGVVLGLLSYKPHFGLLTPIALAAGQRWRTILTAGLTVGSLVLISAALFGWQTWSAYLTAFRHADAVYGSGRIDYAGMVTPYGAARLLAFGPTVAGAIQAVVTGGLMLVVALVWRGTAALPLRAAALVAATLLAVPMAILYDKLVLLVAIGWLVREGRATGFLTWEKAALAVTYPIALLTWNLGTAWHLPLGPVVSSAVLAVCLRRVWCGISQRQTRTEARLRQAVGATP
jgi:hypothetical protein